MLSYFIVIALGLYHVITNYHYRSEHMEIVTASYSYRFAHHKQALSLPRQRWHYFPDLKEFMLCLEIAWIVYECNNNVTI